MAGNKTKATEAGVADYLAAIEDEGRRKDCQALCDLLAKATKQSPKMWGTSIVGFGSYHYQYESGREGDMCLVGFASRKGDISIYGLAGPAAGSPEQERLLSSLGKCKTGKGCLYVRKLADINLKVLRQLVASSVAAKTRTQS